MRWKKLYARKKFGTIKFVYSNTNSRCLKNNAPWYNTWEPSRSWEPKRRSSPGWAIGTEADACSPKASSAPGLVCRICPWSCSSWLIVYMFWWRNALVLVVGWLMRFGKLGCGVGKRHRRMSFHRLTNGELMCMHWVTDRHSVIFVPWNNAAETTLFSTWRFLRFPSNFETLIHHEK